MNDVGRSTSTSILESLSYTSSTLATFQPPFLPFSSKYYKVFGNQLRSKQEKHQNNSSRYDLRLYQGNCFVLVQVRNEKNNGFEFGRHLFHRHGWGPVLYALLK